MADTTTTILSLIKPEEGASKDTWGEKWNTNADIIDSAIGDLQSGKQDTITPATTTEIWTAAAKYMQADDAWATVDPVEIASGAATVELDFGAGTNFEITATGNITLGTTHNIIKGKSGVIEFVHSGAARTITKDGTYWSGPALTLSGASGKRDVLGYYIQNNGKVLLNVVQLDT